MAAVSEPQDPTTAAARLGSRVDEQLAQATSRIRAHDLAFGALVLVAVVLVYATAMILLDRYLNLPQWVRQLSLLGFVGAFAGAAYLTVVSPLRKRINPLYAARKVENTIEDSKNSVTGYVDAQEKGSLNATVKAALASRAAKSVADADVNKAVDHRSLLYLGGVAIALFLTLVVLFFVFRPAQFGSLVRRTFAPFTPNVIRTRTEITLLKPEPAEPTITDGQSITVAVHIAGKIPSADSPERVRLLLRHNPADPNYTELPLASGDTARDWELRVPNHLVQNGFWYKVAAGDAETPEYKVTVRSLPLFTRFQAAYEAPKYLRRPVEIVDGPIIRGYRGTTVLLTAGTNRDARDGVMVIEPGGAAVKSTPVTDDPKAMHFRFTLQESGKYQLTYTTTDGERSADPFRSTITVLADDAPRVVIDKPEEDEATLSANGQLAIDGKAGDDFGVDTITLKMRLTGAAARDLPDQPFLYGKERSFKRQKDGTFPTDVDVKMSADFAAIKKDAAGLDFVPAADMVIEYWLEASDNCEPKPNVGKSAVKRVTLTQPPAEEPQKLNQDRQKAERKEQENKQNADQKQKLDEERRDQPQNNGQQPPPKDGDKTKEGEPKTGEKGAGDPKQGDANPMGSQPEPKQGEEGKGGTPKNADAKNGGMDDKGGMPDAKDPPKNGMNDKKGEKGDSPPKNGGDPQGSPMGPMDPTGGGTGQQNPNTAPPPKSPEDKELQNKADRVKDAIKQENETGGTVKPNETPSEGERTDPGQPKPQPMAGDMNGGMADPKPQPKPDPKSADPMQKPDAAPSAGKPEGSVEKPPEPSTAKPSAPKAGEPKPGDKNAAPAEQRPEPKGGSPTGDEKPLPKAGQPEPKGDDKNGKQDPGSGSSAKPASTPDGGEQPKTPNPADKPDPAGDAGSRAKPMPEADRGADKPAEPKGQPQGGARPDPKSDKKARDAGDAKPEKAPPAAEQKPAPKDDPMNPPGGMGQAEQKPEDKGAQANKPDGKGGAAEAKPAQPDAKNPPMGGAGNGDEKGTEKPQPKDGKGPPQGGAGDKNQQKKLTEQERKELEDAANNLTSPDEAKRKDAQQKLDKAIGEPKRKEMEKLGEDLKSPDEKTREAAKQKLDEMKKQAQKDAEKNGGGGDKKGEAPKLTDAQKKEIADAVNDLQSNDPQKQQAARDKLDKAVGEQNRKDAEQLMNDLKSDDKDRQAAAQKKLDDLKKQMENGQPKKDGDKTAGEPKGDGKEPTPKEIADLAKKAQDLQSKDENKRKQAEKDLDEKLGKENREKLQKELENQKPGGPEAEKKLKEAAEQMAKDRAQKPHDPTGKGLGTGAVTKDAMEEDARNRLKSAELQLDQFEKKRYDEAFKRKQGFTDAEYEKFLNDYSKHVEKMRDDAKRGLAAGEKPPVAGPAEKGGPITAGGGEKVKSLGGASGAAVGGTTTVEPPGFEGLRNKFDQLIKEKK